MPVSLNLNYISHLEKENSTYLSFFLPLFLCSVSSYFRGNGAFPGDSQPARDSFSISPPTSDEPQEMASA